MQEFLQVLRVDLAVQVDLHAVVAALLRERFTEPAQLVHVEVGRVDGELRGNGKGNTLGTCVYLAALFLLVIELGLALHLDRGLQVREQEFVLVDVVTARLVDTKRLLYLLHANWQHSALNLLLLLVLANLHDLQRARLEATGILAGLVLSLGCRPACA